LTIFFLHIFKIFSDFLITAYIFERGEQRTPGELTDLRSSLVNNITLATWTVRYGFYRHLKSTSKYFHSTMISFIKYQAANNHICCDEVL